VPEGTLQRRLAVAVVIAADLPMPIQSQGIVDQIAQAAATPGPAAPAPVPPGRDGSPNGGQVRR